MIPATFAPMILKLVMPKVTDHLMKVFKLDKVLQYVEQPNEADLLGKQNQEHITMIAGEISGLDDRLKKLETLRKKPKKLSK